MNRLFLSLITLFVGIALILVIQSMKDTSMIVYTPSELSKVELETLPRVRVAGKVSTSPYNYTIEPKIQLKFSIINPDRTSDIQIPVIYNKLMPDMFAAGRDVIINGSFKDGILKADSLMTQCPSKYEPPKPTSNEK